MLRTCVVLCTLLTSCGALPQFPDNWAPLPSPTKTSLRGLAVVSKLEFFASGQAGTLLHSVDGGRSFRSCEIPGEQRNELRDIERLADGSVVVMACQPARIYRSTDAGRSFTRVYDAGREAAFLDAMAFFDQRRGLCFGDPLDGRLLVLKTEDGGQSWERVQALPPAAAGEGGFAASGTCLCLQPDGRAWIGTGGPVSRVYRSSDYGQSWQMAEAGLRQGEGAGIFSLDFDAKGQGILVGGRYQEPASRRGNAALSLDGGRSFQTLTTRRPLGYRSCVARHPHHPLICLATGPNGTDLSRDGGRSWQSLSDQGFHVLAFAPDGSCIAAGSEGRIARLSR